MVRGRGGGGGGGIVMRWEPVGEIEIRFGEKH